MIEYSARARSNPPTFDIGPYIARFRKKKFMINNLADINKVLVSSDYGQFLNSLYKSYEPRDYFLAGEIIDSFWKALISNELFEKLHNNLKKKLKI
jgi:hypothetical protein